MNIVLSNPAGFRQLQDVVWQFYYAFARLGHQVEIMPAPKASCFNIIFGAQGLKPESVLKGDYIIYNLEQTFSGLFAGDYAEILKQADTVWDYSAKNTERLINNYGIPAETVFPGYVREMTRLNRTINRDIDILFYGAVNIRRAEIIEAIQKRKINIAVFSGYGGDRDFMIARTRLVINIHYYNPAVLEVARLGYLWANSVPVLSEHNKCDEIPPGLEKACIYADYDHLADAACGALAKYRLLENTAAKGFEAFAGMDLCQILKNKVGLPVYPSGKPQNIVPQILNIGSGKTFMPEALNIDISAQWNPDLVLDISAAINADKIYETARFGGIKLSGNYFSKIIAHDVLEHIPNLLPAMSNILHLLKDGGIADITVPYDLSLGAWQDPTHCRAFNENSWLYYTDWFWYLGWKEFRFELLSQNLIPSAHGQDMLAAGKTIAEIKFLPRAIASMHVLLQKRKTTRKEKSKLAYHDNAYLNNPAPWG